MSGLLLIICIGIIVFLCLGLGVNAVISGSEQGAKIAYTKGKEILTSVDKNIDVKGNHIP